MAKVVARVNRETGEVESTDSMIKRWKKKVDKEGTLIEIRKREFYKTKTERRKEKDKEAQRRAIVAKNRAERAKLAKIKQD